jgi:hypothetical protein
MELTLENYKAAAAYFERHGFKTEIVIHKGLGADLWLLLPYSVGENYLEKVVIVAETQVRAIALG